MATVASLPFAKVPKGYNKDIKDRSSKQNLKSKPSRSMTHPLHENAPKAPKRRPKYGEPFDPEDLTRRLQAYITEQKLVSHRRREARAAKERALALASGLPPLDTSYHHVPSVAAAAFQRTATPNPLTSETVHKLAAPALKAALSPHNPDDSFERCTSMRGGIPARTASTKQGSTNLQKTISADREEVEKEKLRARNAFQNTRDLDDAAEVDELRDVYRMPQRTFVEFSHRRQPSLRPMSTGDVFSDSEDTDTHTPVRATVRLKSMRNLRARPVFEGRNDWAQEQEHEHDISSPREGGERNATWNGRVKERMSGQFQQLRKRESVWVLMGKREKERERSKAEEGLGSGEGSGSGSSPPALDVKRGFLKRFMRTPSS